MSHGKFGSLPWPALTCPDIGESDSLLGNKILINRNKLALMWPTFIYGLSHKSRPRFCYELSSFGYISWPQCILVIYLHLEIFFMQSPSSSIVLYITPTYTLSIQELIMQRMQQKLQKSCVMRATSIGLLCPFCSFWTTSSGFPKLLYIYWQTCNYWWFPGHEDIHWYTGLFPLRTGEKGACLPVLNEQQR